MVVCAWPTVVFMAIGHWQVPDTAEQRPLRRVVHIELKAGTRGGQVWFLTLECASNECVSGGAEAMSVSDLPG